MGIEITAHCNCDYESRRKKKNEHCCPKVARRCRFVEQRRPDPKVSFLFDFQFFDWGERGRTTLSLFEEGFFLFCFFFFWLNLKITVSFDRLLSAFGRLGGQNRFSQTLSIKSTRFATASRGDRLIGRINRLLEHC